MAKKADAAGEQKAKKKKRTGDISAALLSTRAEELAAISEACKILSEIMAIEKVKVFKEVDGTPGYVGSRKQITKWLQRVYDLLRDQPSLSAATKEKLSKAAVSLFAS